MTMNRRRCLCVSLLAFAVVAGAWRHASTDAQEAPKADALETRFAKDVQPLFNRFCYSCHGGKKPEAQLDLKSDRSIQAILKNARHWELVLDRLKEKRCPPRTPHASRPPTSAPP
jgi:hypothetical protein